MDRSAPDINQCYRKVFAYRYNELLFELSILEISRILLPKKRATTPSTKSSGGFDDDNSIRILRVTDESGDWETKSNIFGD